MDAAAAVKALVAALKDADDGVRSRRPGRSGPSTPEAVGLVKALRGRTQVRKQAAWALGAIGAGGGRAWSAR